MVSRSVLSIVIMSIALTSTLAAWGGEELPPIEVAFFYLETCSSCQGREFAEELTVLLAASNKKHRHVSAKSYNLASSENTDKFVEALYKRGLPDLSNLPPILLVNDSFVAGYNDITEVVVHLRDTGEIQLPVPKEIPEVCG